MTDRDEQLKRMLSDVIYNGLDKEKREDITGKYKDITLNDMHIIDRIGLNQAKNMSAVAKEMGVTTGTLTIAVNNLVKKGYLCRERSDRDRRVVLVSLTEKGNRAYRHHEKFHNKMLSELIEGFEEEEIPVLMKALLKIQTFMQED